MRELSRLGTEDWEDKAGEGRKARSNDLVAELTDLCGEIVVAQPRGGQSAREGGIVEKRSAKHNNKQFIQPTQRMKIGTGSTWSQLGCMPPWKLKTVETGGIAGMRARQR